MGELKWIKLSLDMFNNRKIRQIEAAENADTILLIWIRLLMLAGEINDGGYVYLAEGYPYTAEMLAGQLRKPLDVVKTALSKFALYDMIRSDSRGIKIVNWEKYQNIEQMERVREGARNRQQKKRDKDAEERERNDGHESRDNNSVMSRNSNSVMSQQNNAIEEEEEKEEDKKKNKNKKKPIEDFFAGYNLDDSVKSAVYDFCEMRKEIKAPMTDRAIALMIKKLTEMTEDPATQVAILNQSIENSWKGIYELKPRERRDQPSQNRAAAALDDSYRMISAWAEGGSDA